MVEAEIFKILGILKDRFCNGQTQEMIIRHLITLIKHMSVNFEPRCEKTGLRSFRPGPAQTKLYSHRRWLEA